MDEMIKIILAKIPTILTNTSLSEPFFTSVLKRLVSFSYFLKEDDSWAICFAIQKVENHIKNSCNTTSVPDELFNAAVDQVCGEFLFTKKQTGQLKIAELNLNGVITSIHEGDVTVQFANGTSDEEKFNQLLNYLLHSGEGDFVCCRTLKW